MPELPEVETVVRTLRPHLVDRTITRIELERSDILQPPGVNLAQLLQGRTVCSIERRGKRIIFTLDTGERFYIHLGMTGQLTAQNPTAPLRPHTHLILHTESSDVTRASRPCLTAPDNSQKSQIRFRDPRRFGGIWWLGKNPADDTLGPEPLTLRTSQLATRLAKTKRPIKSALLDQQLIAGLGNIYVDEALHAARIHPLTLANKLKLPQIAALNRAIKQVIRKAIHHRGSTLRDYQDASGGKGSFQSRHKVYHRESRPCTTCGKPIQRITLAGRSTHFCPQCQSHRHKHSPRVGG